MATKTMRFYDVSSITRVDYDINTGVLLQLTEGSLVAQLKYRNFGTSTWMDLSESFPLRFKATVSRNIWVISDPHYGLSSVDWDTDFKDAIADMNSISYDYVLVLGDICHEVDKYSDYKTRRGDSNLSSDYWYELPGNHDVPVIDSYKSGLGYSDTYYSFIFDNFLVLMVGDGGTPEITAACKHWIFEQIALHGDKNIIFCTHQPCYDTTRESTADSDHYINDPDGAFNIDKRDIVAWICGHSHGWSGVGPPDSTCLKDKGIIIPPNKKRTITPRFCRVS